MTALKLERVCKSFGDVEVLTDIDLHVEDGEFVVFVGPSGCGKSTLLRVIAGLEDATRGTLDIAGERVNDTPPAKRGIAMVFQSYALYPHLSVRDNMALALKQEKAAQGCDRHPRGRSLAHPVALGLPRPPPLRAFWRSAPAGRHWPRHRARAENSSCSMSLSRTSMRPCA